MRVKLTDICTPKQWKTISTSDLLEKGYPVYGANGIIGYYNEYNHEDPVIAITCRGATCGTINITIPQSYVNGNAMCLDSLRSDVLRKYLYYCLLHYDFNNVISGSAQPQITRQGLEKVTIVLYSLDEQKRIADTLSKIELVINALQQQFQKLDELVKSRFIELFGDPISNPLGWPVKRLVEVSLLITNGNTPKGGSENYVDEGIMFLRSQNVWRNRIDLDDVAYIDAATHSAMEKSSVHDRDILITKTGRINTENSSLGRAALFRGEDNSANINGHVYLVRLDDTMIPEYVVAILTGEPYRRYIRKVCVGGIDKRQINLDQVESFPIIMPPLALQEQFAAFVEQTDKSKLAVQKALDKAQLLFDSLMQQYFGHMDEVISEDDG